MKSTVPHFPLPPHSLQSPRQQIGNGQIRAPSETSRSAQNHHNSETVGLEKAYTTNMPTLLSIPRELRDHILHYVILAQQNEAPPLDQAFNDLVQEREILREPQLRAWSTTVLYQAESVVPNANSLLLVNRQIHVETLENIKRLDIRQYDLDIIILDEILPLPTWLRVPVLMRAILDAVNVTFRIAGRYDVMNETSQGGSEGLYDEYGFYKGFRRGDGAGPAMGWQIYSILERFIKAGPVGKLSDEDAHTHRHIAVKTIDINIETPPDVDPSTFGGPLSDNYLDFHQQNQTAVLCPEYLADFIAQNVNELLCGGNKELFDYGKILYEHVDFIVISRDGEEVRTLDVAVRLKNLGGFEERHLSKKALEEYKVAIWAKRKERGLRGLLDDID